MKSKLLKDCKMRESLKNPFQYICHTEWMENGVPLQMSRCQSEIINYKDYDHLCTGVLVNKNTGYI